MRYALNDTGQATKPIYLMRKLQIPAKLKPAERERERDWKIPRIVFIPVRTSLGSARETRLLALL